ncbi:hypothetical protein D0864_12243 [Hortaea werneckii]|uniref:N-acetylgalactosaminide beta-1,3-galactosyltransferase n=1 Tax=Hortaea werneckii TaxID=91943 RepID=A0A3M7DL38_HORWE|nr:glycosyltransferase family 31 protein [Hortaea werneckii]KAI7344859.1 glycosyltransferase family 31 protein [Hortaea werneckii]RMY64880.1 hypothetical protein D0864_12243 [Hortaea werneckii]RMZ03311.1 hypothetical protein D0862_05702 [Hortaea werneckii]
MPAFLRSTTRVLVLFSVLALFLIGLHLSSLSPFPEWRLPNLIPGSAKDKDLTVNIDPDAPPCQRLGQPDDVVVVMRTGATEIKDKLPIHFNTTFRCYPDFLIFSDYEETFDGFQIHDVLADVDSSLKQSNEDFKHYERLQELGREGLQADELHGESYESGPVGKNDNPGWRLDKWKFLPMIVQSLKLRPEKKWFVFVEPDTYIVWSNMIQWLQKLDARKPLYYGSEVQIGDDIFAHGGTGFVMSRPAMKMGADEYLKNADEWHARTAAHWAGDCILGTALNQAGLPLNWAWPMFQGGNPVDLNWEDAKGDWRLWCTAAISYHHFTSFEIEDMWGWEQQRIAHSLTKQGKQSFWRTADNILHHREVLKEYILPNITEPRQDWNNVCEGIVPDGEGMSLDQCRGECERRKGCLQYSHSPTGCNVSETFRLGTVGEGVTSGWLTDSVMDWMEHMHSCQSKDIKIP